MRRQLLPALRILGVLTVLLGVLYPLAVSVVAQATMGDQADGSLIRNDGGEILGSALIGQPFEGPGWFHPRPSAAGEGYDASASGATNLGPTNPDLHDAVADRVADYRAENGLTPGTLVPVDAVTSSGSGLDPHISVANARLQAPRVARERGLRIATVESLIEAHTTARPLGFLGEPAVNVVALNLAVAG